jgi:hypothetical protein
LAEADFDLREVLVEVVVLLAVGGFSAFGIAGLRTRLALGAGFPAPIGSEASAVLLPAEASDLTIRFAVALLVVDVVDFPISSV